MEKLFGTDGIRGVANKSPITPEVMLVLGKVIASIFKEKGEKKRMKFLIGKDTRLSGYMIENALTAGLLSAGADVLLLGVLPTAAIAFLTKSLRADAGLVISASHNPAEDNGIKVFQADGQKLSGSLEEQIEYKVFNRETETESIRGKLIGKLERMQDAKGRYIEFAKSSIKSASLTGLKIVLDCANGAAYSTAPQVFSELGAEVVVLNKRPDGLNINLNCGALHPENMMETVKKVKADIGIALDGDADRVIVCDEKGNSIDGDQIIAICAVSMQKKGVLEKSGVAVTIMTNKGFDMAMEENGIHVVKTNVGDRNVIEAMRENGYVLGGEQSGHIIFSNNTTTGDGIISALQLLMIIKEEGKKLSELAKCMTPLPQVTTNIEVREKKEINSLQANEAITCAEKILGKKGRVLVRYSGTQDMCRVMVEGENKDDITKITNDIANAIQTEIGA
ncbi:MAG: phosphoglucosamine mutase [Candidatus Scalindua sp. AMX11]|nr:MAG: phosphoglucosamine mutase [Candidatus Scalindua sp.]NOG82737.1 phosphoglucosamine mutase [Planctomycetota bacterium]RZV95306.1 MAG: phosphoglucosamine mutase [Candidatus Scalindua sp. SCAELEC01]TDE66211.1 MAG: phosphoglucosamine mutase [Candidatus Scalindua sp. AMX11]GJQ57832.1 MAG: phosphoglucosamine mutase [Candidatus Scalindua sp.]